MKIMIGMGRKPMDSGMDEYKVKDAFETLTRAEEIKKDAKLMAHVQKHAAQKVHVISSIADLKKARSNLLSKNVQDENESASHETAEPASMEPTEDMPMMKGKKNAK